MSLFNFIFAQQMKNKLYQKLKRILLLLLALYIIGGIALYFLQDNIIFHGEPYPANYRYQFNEPFKQIDLPLDKHNNLSIVQFFVQGSKPKGVVLYFHGNKANINHYAPYAIHFTRNAYEVWMIDYPGFGKTTGELSEEKLYADALLMYRMSRTRFTPDSILIYGRSIGSGIASQLAAIRDCKMLLLETPYYSLESLADRFFFMYPSFLLKYRLKTAPHFPKVDAPVSIFHGTDDGVVPYSQSEKIVGQYPQVNLITIPGGSHNNLHQYPLFQKKIDSLISF